MHKKKRNCSMHKQQLPTVTLNSSLYIINYDSYLSVEFCLFLGDMI